MMRNTKPTSVVIVSLVIAMCIFKFFLVDKNIIVVDRTSSITQDKPHTTFIKETKGSGDADIDRIITQDKPHTTFIKETKGSGDADIDRIVEAANSISDRPVMVSLVNDAFIPFVFSWLCNTKDMGIHKQVLLITTDVESKDKVNKMWPEVKIVVISVNKTMRGAQKYSHAGYVRLVIRRTQILQALLENNIETFMFELDCLWLKNSVPLLHSHSGQYDIIFNGVSGRAKMINGGFLYLFPTNATIEIFMELNRMLRKLDEKLQKMPPGKYISEGHNDQVYMSQLVYKNYAGLKFKVFPMSEFADGKWYSFSQETRRTSHPYLINFNWIIGNNNKISRAKKFGHWFIKEDNTCDNDQITKVVGNWATSH